MRTYLISGPTGVIGKALVDRVVHTEPDAQFILLTRNKENTENSFKSLKNKEIIDWNDLTNYSFERIDYVVHTAAPTASEYFVNKPVETIDSIVNCSKLLLTKAVGTNLKSFIFLSSMEVYGDLESKEKISEDSQGYLSLTSTRSSYPLAKRLSELLCYSFFREYSVPVKIVRPTLVIPKTYASTDNRVIPFALKAILAEKDIVLNTSGESKRDYVSIDDLISAILLILEKGELGQTYNVSNEKTYCSINEMLKILIETKKSEIKIQHELNEKSKFYPTRQCICLDNSRLKNLGWSARDNLKDIFQQITLS